MMAGATALVAAYTTLQVLGRRAGSRPQERAARLPGDELIQEPQMVMNHGITIRARPEEIWPWLSQMGWHLGGYYTPHWVDNVLFPENWESLERLDPQLVRDLRIGDVIPDGKPGTAYFRVARVEPPYLLVLNSRTHLPPGWGEKYGARITWTWTVHVTELPGASTRVHLRVRGHMSPWWLTALYVATIIPADFVMAMGMLKGLKSRVEQGATPASSGREPLRQELYLTEAEGDVDAQLPTVKTAREDPGARKPHEADRSRGRLGRGRGSVS
jgi:hypothetical protein